MAEGKVAEVVVAVRGCVRGRGFGDGVVDPLVARCEVLAVQQGGEGRRGGGAALAGVCDDVVCLR